MKFRITNIPVSFYLIPVCVLLFMVSRAKEYEHPLLMSYEKGIPGNWEKSSNQKLSISRNHYKHGKYSLCWEWNQPGNITLRKDIGFVPFDPTQKDKFIPSFSSWIYNEIPVRDSVTFVFGRDDRDCCRFPVSLNFSGWRNLWVSYERDMRGIAVTGMNFMRLESPPKIKKGSLFLDHTILCINIDSRHHSPDFQVPFVNANTNNHWLLLYHYSQAEPDLPAPEMLSEKDMADLDTIESRYLRTMVTGGKTTTKELEKLRNEYKWYQIKRNGNYITGLPIWFIRNEELYIPWAGNEISGLFVQNRQEVSDYFDLMFSISKACMNASDPGKRSELRQMFSDLFDHMEDQGIAAGSALGTIHHYGYSWRSYFKALYLMKDYLSDSGRLKRAMEGMQWYSGIGETYFSPEMPGMDMDAFNTKASERLAGILIMDDSPAKMQKLACFSRWFNNGLLPAPGLADAFKRDGSLYHHANHYPAYGTGGLDEATRIVYLLSGTQFAASPEGHKTIRNALLTMRFYCNLLEWPVSMAGRHPGSAFKMVPLHFAYMADAGTPGGMENPDREMAEAYLRLMLGKKNDPFVKKYLARGFKPEKAPTGNIVMPYASAMIHRREEWSASVRGHSRYLWAAEHYIGANYYGRYMGHGTLQILENQPPATGKTANFIKEGFDWNRFPGTTTIHLPLDMLRANILNVDQYSGFEEMLYSDQAFAGGVNMDNRNGVYAFILHEHDKYNGSHRARKAFFFFDNKIICTGTGIENSNTEFATETTLFQTPVRNNNFRTGILPDRNLPETGEWIFNQPGIILTDTGGNGYYIPSGKILVKQGIQLSKDPKTEKENSGPFATAVIQHGKAPQNERYLYYMLVHSDSTTLAQFAAGMKGQHPPFTILRQDNQAHIVRSENDHTNCYVFFEPAAQNLSGCILRSNIPFMAMTRENNDTLRISVSNPDLALYEGASDELYENGKRVERSIYSRPWIYNESRETILELEIKGVWSAENHDADFTQTPVYTTILRFKCKDGAVKTIDLVKK